ncbi:ATP-binding protein [Streptomyces sp. NPDC046831]|uniref:ATP-binding protein n=1 Tax=Streptomyces sp. NPDC046831 TaxID=3154805 RepID=UPI0034035ED5
MATVTDGQLRSPGEGPVGGGRAAAAAVTDAPLSGASPRTTAGRPTAGGARRPGGTGGGEPVGLCSTVPADPCWASAVRRMVTRHLVWLRLPADQIDSAVLATDELFANAVEHAGRGPRDTVTVTLECRAHTLRVTVADPSPARPRRRTADAAAESGRGLAIVAALADDWGTAPPEPGRPGKRVWFTLRPRAATP